MLAISLGFNKKKYLVMFTWTFAYNLIETTDKLFSRVDLLFFSRH